MFVCLCGECCWRVLLYHRAFFVTLCRPCVRAAAAAPHTLTLGILLIHCHLSWYTLMVSCLTSIAFAVLSGVWRECKGSYEACIGRTR